jgi:subtilisin family serine protease
MNRRILFGLAAALVIGACSDQQEPTPVGPDAPEAAATGTSGTVRVNVLLKTAPTDKILAELGTLGSSVEAIPQIKAVTLRTSRDQIPAIRALSYVLSVNEDVEVKGSPVDAVSASNFLGGFSTWDQDAVDITAGPGAGTRSVSQTGKGVFIGVLDTGLLDTWRQYFPEQQIATALATSFVGSDNGSIAEQPNKWEHDVNSHGTHVTSTILGYSFRGTPITGSAPLATVIPVKVLNQNGSGSSAAVARGMVYIADLKLSGKLAGPVVINMSLGGPTPDAITEAAVDYAVNAGVILVAAAGNEADAGMGWPGAYQKVISVAASGWVGEWRGPASWWNSVDVPEKKLAAISYITDFSSREKAGQDLDVAAPGSWVVGPYQLQNGQISYFFLGGTSMASPHVAGIVALMAQVRPGLTPAQAETVLESAAIPLAAGCRDIVDPNVGPTKVCWGSDATGHGLITADAALAGL